MPETIAYGKVVGRFIQAVGDTADVDLLPDVVPIQGNITLTPANPLSKEVSVAPPTTVVRSTITCSLNSQGLLVSPAGDVGVWLVAGIYKVVYSTQGAAIPPHDIVVSPLHTSENPLDLTLALPPGGPVLTPSEYAELSARLDTLLPEVSWDGDVLVVDGESSPPLTGPTGPAVGVTWEGDVLTVDGESSPPLTGPASTVPGPPNVLSKGTVTTSDPGEDADFTINGVSPNQTLDLVIPRGLTGPQGLTRYLVQSGASYPARPFPTEVPVTFVGTANPDTLGVMVIGDSWINTAADQVIPYVKHYDGAGSPEGVVAAQIGSRYIDVNATCGAVEWIKVSGTGNSGWKVAYGDTGWRSLIDGSRQIINNLSGWRTDLTSANRSLLHIRRVNDLVYINGWEIYPPAGSSTYWGATQPRQGGITKVPVGFRGVSAASWSAQPSLASWNSAAYQNQNMLGTIFPLYGNATLDGWPDVNVLTVGQPSGATTNTWQVSMNMIYRTNDNWPTTLPGTAA